MKVWQIRKIGEDQYHVWSKELDEEVNGVQFMGMLNAKQINEAQIQDILLDLDTKVLGYKTEIIFTPEPVF